MPVANKVWGRTQDLLKTPLVELHALTIKANGYCSKHKHEFKANAFFVIDGELEVSVFKNDYALTDVTTLGPGDLMVVKAGEFHQFRAVKDTDCLELYYPEALSEDIVRESVGGKGP